MAVFEEIEKIEAARRQLVAGIELFFERRDPIVVHTVAWASYQILIDMCEDRGIERQIEDSPILKEIGAHQDFLRAFRKPHNFLKHADKDPAGVVKFFPDSNYLVLLMAVEYFTKITNQALLHGQVLRAWFFIKHPERAPAEWGPQIQQLRPAPDPNDYELFRVMLESAANNSLKRTAAGRLGVD